MRVSNCSTASNVRVPTGSVIISVLPVSSCFQVREGFELLCHKVLGELTEFDTSNLCPSCSLGASGCCYLREALGPGSDRGRVRDLPRRCCVDAKSI